MRSSRPSVRWSRRPNRAGPHSPRSMVEFCSGLSSTRMSRSSSTTSSGQTIPSRKSTKYPHRFNARPCRWMARYSNSCSSRRLSTNSSYSRAATTSPWMARAWHWSAVEWQASTLRSFPVNPFRLPTSDRCKTCSIASRNTRRPPTISRTRRTGVTTSHRKMNRHISRWSPRTGGTPSPRPIRCN